VACSLGADTSTFIATCARALRSQSRAFGSIACAGTFISTVACTLGTCTSAFATTVARALRSQPGTFISTVARTLGAESASQTLVATFATGTFGFALGTHRFKVLGERICGGKWWNRGGFGNAGGTRGARDSYSGNLRGPAAGSRQARLVVRGDRHALGRNQALAPGIHEHLARLPIGARGLLDQGQALAAGDGNHLKATAAVGQFPGMLHFATLLFAALQFHREVSLLGRSGAGVGWLLSPDGRLTGGQGANQSSEPQITDGAIHGSKASAPIESAPWCKNPMDRRVLTGFIGRIGADLHAELVDKERFLD
jgi:hypothetical protein